MTFKELFEKSKSVHDLATKLGYKKKGSKLSASYYRIIKLRCDKEGLDYAHLSRRTSADEYDADIIRLAPQCTSIRDIISKMGLSLNSGSLCAKIRSRIFILGIDVSHFTGSMWNRGKTRFTSKQVELNAKAREVPWEQAFRNGSSTKNESLMKRLIAVGKRTYSCSVCGIKKWNEKPLRLRLDHIDGNNTNNTEENLRFICPNCDSQTETFSRGTKKKLYKRYWWEDLSEAT